VWLPNNFTLRTCHWDGRSPLHLLTSFFVAFSLPLGLRALFHPLRVVSCRAASHGIHGSHPPLAGVEHDRADCSRSESLPGAPGLIHECEPAGVRTVLPVVDHILEPLLTEAHGAALCLFALLLTL